MFVIVLFAGERERGHCDVRGKEVSLVGFGGRGRTWLERSVGVHD